MASTTGIAPVTSTFAGWRSNLTELRGQIASVTGLAPVKPGLKGRLRELLCIQRTKSFPRDVLGVPEVGIAPTSPRLQRGANLPQLLGGASARANWSSRQVTLLRLPVISRVLCF